MKKIFYVFILFFLCVHTILAKQSGAQLLQTELEKFHTIKANFEQVVKSSNGVVLQHYIGNLAIKRPGKFYWNVKKPIKQIIASNGNKVWIYEPDLQQLIIKNLHKSVGQTPVLLLTNQYASLKHGFCIKQLHSSKNVKSFALLPKDKQTAFTKIILSFVNGKVWQMSLVNQLGQNSLLKFSNVKINVELNSKIFNISVPDKTDIIDQTKI